VTAPPGTAMKGAFRTLNVLNAPFMALAASVAGPAASVAGPAATFAGRRP